MVYLSSVAARKKRKKIVTIFEKVDGFSTSPLRT